MQRRGVHDMPNKQRQGDDGFRQARAAVRLQRSVLPERAVQLLADEVVIRLANRLHPPAGVGQGHAPAPAVAATEDFVRALLSEDTDAAMAIIRKERQDGQSLEAIYLGTLAAGARRLGEMWERDDLSFLQMSVAAGRIFEIMRMLRRTIMAPPLELGPVRQALFASVPGELHTLGVTMAADLFRNRGWEIDLRTGYEHEELLRSIADKPFRIIGLSAAHGTSVMALTRLVVALRITHPEARIFVSGTVVAEVPDLNALIRADAVLQDGDNAIEILESFLLTD
jgi:MerR family transcriptional regulator, light-induced transcriptional regulator